MAKNTYNATRNVLMDNPAASNWLKQAVTQMENRDPLDAQLDAAYLSQLMSKRADEMLDRVQHAIYDQPELEGDNVLAFKPKV